MVYLVIHLPEEAIRGKPVHLRWMYPFEHFLGSLKKYVKNRARPEGSIAEAYILNEALTFCSLYLTGVETRFNRLARNWVDDEDRTVKKISVSDMKKIECHLSDIGIATSAAPTYLPAHYFRNTDDSGKSEEFDLIHGGILKHDPEFNTIKAEDFRFLLISLGTGSNRIAKKYDAKTCAKWGPVNWIMWNGNTPITDVFMEASSDMVDYHNTLVFEAFRSQNHLLRIEDETLRGDLASVDKLTPQNLRNLENIGKQLLKKPLSRMNLRTGRHEPVPNGGTNADPLKSFAKMLSDERKLRLSNAKAAVGK
ncbi:patatin-like protein 3 [Morus notabilis]|uniref:patatin-like protein 3 n=1 Tax=Morus notabilis TaxID=981085 RepID=UPI000CECE739|nr:patatin-like protein 3 [Morus notabilis]